MKFSLIFPLQKSNTQSGFNKKLAQFRRFVNRNFAGFYPQNARQKNKKRPVISRLAERF
jgi:hypothetical protein